MKSQSSLAQAISSLATQPDASTLIQLTARAIDRGLDETRVIIMLLETYETHLAHVTKMAEDALRSARMPPVVMPAGYDPQKEQLLRFVEEVRRQTGCLIALTQSHPQRAQEMAAELCTQAATFVSKAE